MGRFKQIDLKKVTTVNLDDRRNKVAVDAFGRTPPPDGAREFFDSLPDFLQATRLREFITLIKKARDKKQPCHFMMGAHVIKVGLSKIIIDLMENDILTGISLNSAGLIHDLEMATIGHTSEDVQSGLNDGSFGMAGETARHFAAVIETAASRQIGLGEAAGIHINRAGARYAGYSLFAAADRLDIPATIHLAVGTDIVQQHDIFKPGPAAEASFRDFKILSSILSTADRGGVVVNIGSAVILPEVFLKALTVARNIDGSGDRIVTANFDMFNHYRPCMNVVRRPVNLGGQGFNFIGHHEIMIPLLAWGLKSNIGRNKNRKGV